jgi:hypothetical protein
MAAVDANLPGLKPIKNRLIDWILRVIPWLMLVFLFPIVWPSNPFRIPGRVMFYTGYIAAGVALVIFRLALTKIFPCFASLYQRGILESRAEGKSAPPVMEYHQFCHHLEEDLNHRRSQWIMAVLFVVLVSSWFFYRRPFSTLQRPILLVGFVVEMILSFLIGFLAWRMLAVGRAVWNLPASFTLKLDVLHPDKCGGLEPLGNLCLWNALIISCAGIYIGGWLAVEPKSTLWEQAQAYRPVFQLLLGIPMTMAVITFFLPLMQTHLEMVVRKREIQIRLDEMAQKISAADDDLLRKAEDLGADEVELKMKNLAIMRKVYDQYQYIPEWPVNFNLLTKFCLSQTVPVLSLIGISEPIVKAVGDLIKLVQVPGS